MNSNKERKVYRSNSGRKQAGAINVIRLGLVALVLILGILIGVYREGMTPEAVNNLNADTCYSRVALSWDGVKGADGYQIYKSDNSTDFEIIGETDNDTLKFNYDDFDSDSSCEFKVCAFAKNNLTGKISEGESTAVVAEYDSSKYAQKIPILTYHQVIPAGRESDTSLAITEDAFEEQMKYLHDNGYTTLTLDEFYQWHAGKKEFPVNSVLITFDDGFAGVYFHAYPIIKKYEQAATLFCIGKNSSGVTEEYNPDSENAQYVKQDVIEKVRKEYPRFEFESHTYNMHARVDGKIPAKSFTLEQIEEDCNQNKDFGFRYIAYPWGSYSETMQEAVKNCNYKMAFAYRPFYYALRSDDTYAINRIKIRGAISIESFMKIASGENDSYNNPDAPENRED